jgi:tetratricopeptide (TPR) repeat protein
MGTIEAPTPPTAQGHSASSVRPGRLWQAPVFIAGLIAVLAAWLARPPARPDPDRVVEQRLLAAREELARPDCDPAQALDMAQQALDAAELVPDRVGEAHMMVGTAHLHLGAATTAALAQEHYTLARQHLQTAERLGVPPEEQGRLLYRLGKVGHLLKDDPRRVVELLAAGVEHADDRAEGYDLLTRAYLSLTPPNVKEALKANEKLRQGVAQVDERVLAPARLLGGDLLLQMGKPDQARKVLERIGEQAPPEVLTQARLLRGQTYQAEGKWKEAAELWQAVLEDKRAAPPEPGKILYNLGVCHRGLDEAREAAAAWEQCLRPGHGDEGPAAALALAELRLPEAEGGPERAVALLARAAEHVTKPQEWANSLVELSRACEVFERIAAALRQAGRFDLTVQLTTVYQRLAPPGRAAVQRAGVYVEWARSHTEKAQGAADLLVRRREEGAANELYRHAGTAHAEAADQVPGKADQADQLWQSAACYRQGEDHRRAAAVLERFLQSFPASPRQGEGWYQLAESYRHLNHEDAARKAYLRCIEFPTPFAYKAQYHLALTALKEGQTDRAEEILLKNLQDMVRSDPDPEAQENSLFTLGNILYQRGNWSQAVRHLEEATNRFPDNPEATRAHFQLADSYRRLADQEHQTYLMNTSMSDEARKHFEEEHRRWLRKAADEFAQLAEFLQKPQARGHLSAEELLWVPLIAAQCFFDLGEYDKALERYQQLAQQHRGRTEGFQALAGLVKVYVAKGKFDLVAQVLEEMRKSLDWLPAEKRAAWEAWLQIAGKQVNNPAPPPRPAP